jgi:anti-sigma B factor antagonist
VTRGGLSFFAESVAGVNVLHVAGEVDSATGPEFIARLEAAVDPDRGLVIDMRGVSYIDLRGVKALETAGARASAAGQRIAVVSSSTQFRRLFTILHAEGRTELVTTLEDAVRLVGG